MVDNTTPVTEVFTDEDPEELEHLMDSLFFEEGNLDSVTVAAVSSTSSVHHRPPEVEVSCLNHLEALSQCVENVVSSECLQDR